MQDKHIDIFHNLINEIHEFIKNKINMEKNSMLVKSTLGESYISINTLLENSIFQPHEEVILKRDLSKIYKEIYDDSSLFYYSSFYYAYRKIKAGDPQEIQLQFQKINLDTMAMLINILSISKTKGDLGSSTEDYFFSRMENCTWAFKYVLNHKLKDYYVPSLYSICNMIQTLILYKKSAKNKYISDVNILLTKLEQILKDFISSEDIQVILERNNHLRYFIDNQILDMQRIHSNEIIYETNLSKIENERNRGALRILTNLYNLDKGKFKEYFEMKIEELEESVEDMHILDKILFVRVLSNYYSLTKKIQFSEIGLYEELELKNVDEFINHVFRLNEISISDVTEEDLDKLLQMKDDELRIKFSKTVNGVEERILQRESQKPHGAFEISDMELPITFRGKRYFMCLPFKSGVEIRGNTVPVDISYQIVRPFIEFKNCVVVFVTAKKCSENLMNYIKKLKDSLNWPIEVIEHETLAALLKNAGEL
ncbi:hypothetical protein [Caldifermentibacillus hisashii]|uniref:hypothetical protein n=1 Tax=Caldifermentibacillus hisashii TaxID=996558 RepID=UPI0031B7198D